MTDNNAATLGIIDQPALHALDNGWYVCNGVRVFQPDVRNGRLLVPVRMRVGDQWRRVDVAIPWALLKQCMEQKQ